MLWSKQERTVASTGVVSAEVERSGQILIWDHERVELSGFEDRLDVGFPGEGRIKDEIQPRSLGDWVGRMVPLTEMRKWKRKDGFRRRPQIQLWIWYFETSERCPSGNVKWPIEYMHLRPLSPFLSNNSSHWPIPKQATFPSASGPWHCCSLCPEHLPWDGHIARSFLTFRPQVKQHLIKQSFFEPKLSQSEGVS